MRLHVPLLLLIFFFVASERAFGTDDDSQSAAIAAIQKAGGQVGVIAYQGGGTTSGKSESYLVNLHSVKVDDYLITSLAALPDIGALDLLGSNISEAQFLRLQNLTNLQQIWINGAAVTSAIIDRLCQFEHLNSDHLP